MLLFQFPSVQNPQTLEKRYQGILSGILIDFVKVNLKSPTNGQKRKMTTEKSFYDSV